MDLPGLSDRLARVRQTIAEHQARAGWDHDVVIVAVTKTLGPEAVDAVARAGLTDVGENRVQEALAKQDALPDCPVAWHFIGGLQRKKARQVVGRFALIHSVDRPDLADELHKRVPDGEGQDVLVQVNCSGEPQKGGVEPGALEGLLDHLAGLDRLRVRGLMTMAALTEHEAAQRGAFALLRDLRDRMRDAGHPVHELSMGMSNDYPVAVEEGATMVRLGTVLLGERNQ